MTLHITRRYWIFGLIITVLVGLSIALVTFFLQSSSQDLRQKADAGSGVVDIAFTTPSEEVEPGDIVTMPLVATGLDGSALEGIQVVATLAFSPAPPTDLAFTSNNIPGLRVLGTPFQITTNGANLLLAFVPDGSGNLVNPTGSVILGTLTFTAPANTDVLATFDELKTKILQRVTGLQMVKGVSTTQLTVVHLSPIVTPAASPTPNPDQEYDADLQNLGGMFPNDENDLEDERLAQTNGNITQNTTSSTGGITALKTQTKTQNLLPKKTASQAGLVALPEELPASGSFQVLILTGLGFLLFFAGLFSYAIVHKRK